MNYSGYLRWKQQKEQWQKDFEAIEAWKYAEPVVSSPPPVSFRTCVPSCPCEVCTLKTKYAAAVDELDTFFASMTTATTQTNVNGPDREETTEGCSNDRIKAMIDADVTLDENTKKMAKTRLDEIEAVLGGLNKHTIEFEVEQCKNRLVFKVYLAARELESVGIEIHSRYERIFNSIWYLIDLRNQPSLTQISSEVSEDFFGGRIDTSEHAWTGSAGWIIAKSPSDLCFEDIVDRERPTKKRATPTPIIHESSPIGSHGSNLRQFQMFVEDLFQNASEVDSKNSKFYYLMSKTARLILAWIPNDTRNNLATTKAFIPSSSSKEIKGSRMILSAILCKIACFSENDGRFSSICTQPIHSIVSHVAQHLNEAFADVCFAPINTKVEERVTGTSNTVPAPEVQLVLGQLAEQVYEAFCFGGIGVDRKYRGVVLTLTSVEVLELELLNMGTPKMHLVFRRSGVYPLFDAKTSGTLLGVKNKTRLAKFTTKLVNNDPSKGFEILASFMTDLHVHDHAAVTHEVAYRDSCEASAKEIGLVKFLGSGSFGFLYALKEERSYLKIPRKYSAVQSLQQESTILQALDHVGIPNASASLGYLKVSLRCEASMLRCLRLEGLVGTPAWGFIFDDVSAIRVVCEEVMDALEHAHLRNIVHLDVCPNNIIVHQGMDGLVQAQVVDWGCASFMTTYHSSFRGKEPFAHDDLLTYRVQNKSWTAIAEFDLASLVYTMATIVFNSETGSERICAVPQSIFRSDALVKPPRPTIPWDLDDDNDPDCFETRLKVARKKLGKLALGPNHRKKLLRALRSQTEMSFNS